MLLVLEGGREGKEASAEGRLPVDAMGKAMLGAVCLSGFLEGEWGGEENEGSGESVLDRGGEI